MGRASAFSDPEIIRLARDRFVPVVGDDWYQRRRQDAEGEFFRTVSDRAGRGANGGTRQGIYCLAADGTLLAFKNAGNSPEATRAQLREALAKWDRLPPARTAPGAVEVPASFAPDPKYHRARPPGGLAVRVFSRILDATPAGYAPGASAVPGGDKAGRDVLWLTAAEVRGFGPPDPTPGASHPLPPAVADRLVRFHLLDNTRGEPPAWEPDQVKRAAFTLTVRAVDNAGADLLLEGDALLEDGSDRGFDVRVRGEVRYDAVRRTLTRFEVAAVGEHWGTPGHQAAARPGRTFLGLAFGLADGSKPLDGIPPQGVRNDKAYFGLR